MGGGGGAEGDGGFWGVAWFSRGAEGGGGGGGGVGGPRLMEDFGEALDFQGEQRGEGAQSSLTKFMGGGGGKERKSVREVIRSLEY